MRQLCCGGIGHQAARAIGICTRLQQRQDPTIVLLAHRLVQKIGMRESVFLRAQYVIQIVAQSGQCGGVGFIIAIQFSKRAKQRIPRAGADIGRMNCGAIIGHA